MSLECTRQKLTLLVFNIKLMWITQIDIETKIKSLCITFSCTAVYRYMTFIQLFSITDIFQRKPEQNSRLLKTDNWEQCHFYTTDFCIQIIFFKSLTKVCPKTALYK